MAAPATNGARLLRLRVERCFEPHSRSGGDDPGASNETARTALEREYARLADAVDCGALDAADALAAWWGARS